MINQDNESKGDYIIIASEGMGYIWGEKIIKYILGQAFPNKKIIFDSNPSNPDIVIRGLFFSLEREKVYNCPYISWSQEPIRVPTKQNYRPLCELNCFIPKISDKCIKRNSVGTSWVGYTEVPKDVKSFYVPFLIYSNYKINSNTIREFNQINYTDRGKMCIYVARNARSHRNILFRKLKKLDDTCEALGKCENTQNGKVVEGDFNNLIGTYKNYRFALVLENENLKGYVTEKIVNAFVAGCIPIYWGSDGFVKQIFNPNAYIDLTNLFGGFPQYDDTMFDYHMEMVAKYINGIDKDRVKFYKLTNEPVFKNNVVPDYFNYMNRPEWIDEIINYVSQKLGHLNSNELKK
jgi:hypothetical protein